MKNLEEFLKAYRLNLENFDLEIFLDDLLDIPNQVMIIERNFDKLTDEQKEQFFKLNKKLADLIEHAQPKNELQEKALQLLRSISKQQEKEGHIAA